MDNQWIIRWTALGGENGQHRLPVQGVGPQAVHGFGGKGHQLSAGQKIRGQGKGFVIGAEHLCIHG